MTHNTPTIQQDLSLLEQALIAKAKQYLNNQLLLSLKDDIHTIATDAVKHWAEVKLEIQPKYDFDTNNIHIAFIEKVIRTEMKDHPIQIIVNTKKDT